MNDQTTLPPPPPPPPPPPEGDDIVEIGRYNPVGYVVIGLFVVVVLLLCAWLFVVPTICCTP